MTAQCTWPHDRHQPVIPQVQVDFPRKPCLVLDQVSLNRFLPATGRGPAHLAPVSWGSPPHSPESCGPCCCASPHRTWSARLPEGRGWVRKRTPLVFICFPSNVQPLPEIRKLSYRMMTLKKEGIQKVDHVSNLCATACSQMKQSTLTKCSRLSELMNSFTTVKPQRKLPCKRTRLPSSCSLFQLNVGDV